MNVAVVPRRERNMRLKQERIFDAASCRRA